MDNSPNYGILIDEDPQPVGLPLPTQMLAAPSASSASTVFPNPEQGGIGAELSRSRSVDLERGESELSRP